MTQIERLIRFLKNNQNKEFTARQIAEHLVEDYHEIYMKKKKRSNFSYKKLITQVSAEISAEAVSIYYNELLQEGIQWRDKPRPRVFWYQTDKLLKPKHKSEKREHIYAVEMNKSYSGDTHLYNIKIGHTTNVRRTLSSYQRGNPGCKIVGLWYANPEVKATDCEKGIHKIANECGYKQKRETFVFIDDEFSEFLKFVDLLLKKDDWL